MNLITIENLAKQYSDRVLLDGVDLLINQGDRIGLIGANGSGKTTLLRVIAGLEPPDSGNLTIWGSTRIQYLSQTPDLDDSLTVLDQIYQSPSERLQLVLAYERTAQQLARSSDDPALQQKLHALSEEMARLDGWAAEAEAKAILSRLGIDDFDARVGTLSGGQRKRVALARALLDPADLLILDEPTNHIDAETITWLEDYLHKLDGALLMVTHDRYFLERVVNKIVELDRRDLVTYPGNYSRYLELRARREEHLAAVEEKRRVQLRRELAWLRSGVLARGTRQKARKQRAADLQVIKHDLGEEKVTIALTSRRLGKKVLSVEGLAKSFDGNPVFSGVDFHLNPGDRIGIMGLNGAGKSTFLNLLAGQLSPDAGSIEWGSTVHLAYYDQQAQHLLEAVDAGKTVIDFINDVAPLIRTPDGEKVEAAQMLTWFLFSRKEQRTKIESLSGGERRRLYLLYTLAQRPNVIFLDEPTNDLDIVTLQVLEDYLDQFAGCMIVVSHDRYFLDRNVDFLVEFRAGTASGRYPTPYETFRRLREVNRRDETGPDKKKKSPPAQGAKQVDTAPERRKRSYLEQREYEQLEEKIGVLEARKAELENEMAAHAADYEKLQELHNQKTALEDELEEAFQRWLELS